MAPEAPLLRTRRLRRWQYIHQASGAAGRARQRAAYRRQLSFLPGDRTQILRANCAAVGNLGVVTAGEWTLAARGNRKALWTRSGFRAGAEPRYQEGVAGKPDLPHRSLPRQRNGAEHHGL